MNTLPAARDAILSTAMDAIREHLPTTIWRPIGAGAAPISDEQQFRRGLEVLAKQLREDIATWNHPTARRFRHNYGVLKMLAAGPKLQLVPQASAYSDEHDQILTSHLLEWGLASAKANPDSICDPRSKQYEKAFLYLLTGLLNTLPVRLSNRRQARIAIDLIRWAGGHPASASSIARYIRGIRGGRYGLPELISTQKAFYGDLMITIGC